MVRKNIIFGAGKILRKLPAVPTILTIYLLFIYLFSSAQSLMSNQVRSAPSSVSGWGGNHYFQNQARCRLDARLWLTCRLALARGLAEEDSGMGKLGGSVRSVTSSIGSCLHHCQQGNERESILQDALNSYSWDCWWRQGFWQNINNLLAGLRVNCWHYFPFHFHSLLSILLSFNKFKGHKFISFIITVTYPL